MNQFRKTVKRALPAISAVIVFFIVSAVCFAPQFEGRVLPQHDIQQFDGMSRDIRECRDTYGEDPQWTGAMFGGMPAYMINIRYPAQILKQAGDALTGMVGTPTGFIFFAMLSAWLMAVMMGMSAWVGIVVGLAYGLSTYFFLIIGAGHVTKMWALVFAPAMMGSIYMALRGNALTGGALAALFAALEIGANHPQITYYFMIAAVALWLNDLVFAIRGKRLADFAKRTGILAAAALLALGANFSPAWYAARHTAETTRGGSELAEGGAAKGLDLEYATAWSYGRTESWNMLIADFAGGDSGRTFSGDGPVAASMKDVGLEEYAQYLPTYWGDQPYTAGPTYLGAAAVFLALLGALLADRRNRWWVLASTLIAILLAWGHNLMWFTEFCFKYLPFYNKFRTVSMALVVVEWTIPLLAGFGLWQLWRTAGPNGRGDEAGRRRTLRAVAWAAGITGGIALLFAVAGGSLFDFGHEKSYEMMSSEFYRMLRDSGGDELIARGMHDELGWRVADAMATERAEIMQSDAWRSFALIAATAAFVALFAAGKLRREWMLAAVGALVLADLAAVDMRYLPHEKFVTERRNRIVPTDADRAIMADTTLGYRVLNLSVSPFNDATTSMFHRSVGGYHGAKLGRYQDIIDRYLTELDEGVLDMLDTRYIITPDGGVMERPTANGAAWTVGEIVVADNARQELDATGRIDKKVTAVVSAGDAGVAGRYDVSGTVELAEYRPNRLLYRSDSPSECAVIFSEIYFADGWKMYVDGVESPYFRADYILRGAVIPAGRHEIEWRFRAPGWNICEAVTLICSLLIIFALAITVIYNVRDEKKRRAAQAQS